MNLDRLDATLAEEGADGYLIDADAEEADQRYLSGFDAPDPYITLYTPAELRLLVSELEYGRARKADRPDVVERHSAYDFADLRKEYGDDEARGRMIAAFLASAGVDAVVVPKRFPLETADALREHGIHVQTDRMEILAKLRARKTDAEIEHIRTTQRANEAALRAAEEMVREAEIRDGTLYHEEEPLTAERVKEEIEITLLRHGCGLNETIVAGGESGADPHERGSGPLPAHEPIVIDVFPQDKETKYHADMTRTFVRGEASDAVRTRHELTREAKEAALASIQAGVTGEAVHDAACTVYEEAGFDTLRSTPQAETGFIHSTGHGVGLDIHERPRLAPGGPPLEEGMVITVEPGLYDPAVGGIRVEDIVVVTEDGHENLTDYHESLVL